MDDQRVPVTAHLAELRTRIIRILIAWTLGFVAVYTFREPLFDFLFRPAIAALPEGEKLQAIAPTEIFFTYLKTALFGGFLVALPVIFWQIWAFVSPGLYANERRTAVPFVFMSTLLFLGGATFGYTAVFPIMFPFFADFDNSVVASAWTLREVFALCSRMFLAFGVAFELPIAIVFFSMLGIVSPRQLLASFKYAILVIFVVSAILTPQDVVSQLLLAGPLMVLYLIGVAVAFVLSPRRKKTEDTTDGAVAP